MNTTVYILKISNQLTDDGTYDYVRIAGVFFNFDDAIRKAKEKLARMKEEWPEHRIGKHNNCTFWIQTDGMRKWYEVIEQVVK